MKTCSIYLFIIFILTENTECLSTMLTLNLETQKQRTNKRQKLAVVIQEHFNIS